MKSKYENCTKVKDINSQNKLMLGISLAIKILLISIILVGLFTRCTKFVQIAPSIATVSTGNVFNSDANATSAQLAIYTQIVNNFDSWFMSQNLGLMSDELTNYSSNIGQVQFYKNSLNASTTSTQIWQNFYKYIYQANAIITGLQNSSSVSIIVKEELTGESKFIRAFCYLFLTNLYGDIPLLLSADYTINKTATRTARTEIYHQIINDLTDAEKLLNSKYVDATDTVVTAERVRPNKSSAAALLARAYLYANKYDSAESQASQVINNPMYSLIKPLMVPSTGFPSNYGFTKNNTEVILQFGAPLPVSSGATYDGQYFILTSAPSTSISNSITLSPQLYNSFETGDSRKNVWIGSYKTSSTPSVTYYFPYKYKTNNSVGTSISEYIMVLRLSEQYLIRAEARAQQNNSSGAISDLNVIRNRAGLTDYSGANNKDSLEIEIMHERQVELFSEWGHRWFDLNRTGFINSVMGSPGNVCQGKMGVWNPNWRLFPIPQTEINSDLNLTQNPGY